MVFLHQFLLQYPRRWYPDHYNYSETSPNYTLLGLRGERIDCIITFSMHMSVAVFFFFTLTNRILYSISKFDHIL